MQHRNPLTRPQLFVIGAAPTSVSMGLPGAHDEVRAYAERIRMAWDAFWNADFVPWAKQNGFGDIAGAPPTPGGKVIGDVLGSDPAKVAEQKKKIALFDTIVNDRNAFMRAYDDAQSATLVTGDSASSIWQALFLKGETALKNDRQAMVRLGWSFTSPEPGALESQGGVDGPLDSLSKTVGQAADTAKTIALVAGILGVTFIAVTVLKKK